MNINVLMSHDRLKEEIPAPVEVFGLAEDVVDVLV
jgi:hypothetical protein